MSTMGDFNFDKKNSGKTLISETHAFWNFFSYVDSSQPLETTTSIYLISPLSLLSHDHSTICTGKMLLEFK